MPFYTNFTLHYTHTNTHIHAYRHIHPHYRYIHKHSIHINTLHTRTCACVCTHTHMRTHVYTHTRAHARVRTHTLHTHWNTIRHTNIKNFIVCYGFYHLITWHLLVSNLIWRLNTSHFSKFNTQCQCNLIHALLLLHTQAYNSPVHKIHYSQDQASLSISVEPLIYNNKTGLHINSTPAVRALKSICIRWISLVASVWKIDYYRFHPISSITNALNYVYHEIRFL